MTVYTGHLLDIYQHTLNIKKQVTQTMAQQLYLAISPQFYTITYNINYKNGIEQHKLDSNTITHKLHIS